MSQYTTSTKIINASHFDGKKAKYITTLQLNDVGESKYQIMTFITKEIDDSNNVYPEIIHHLENENIIYSPNEIKKLTHKNNNIRPVRMGSLDVYVIIYDSKPGWVQEANIPCELITDAIEQIPKHEIKKETRGRHKKYASDVERKEAQQRHALLHHYRKEALENYLKSNPNDEIITVKVDVSSRVLGEFNEEITYKKLPDGSYRKLHK